MNIESSVRAYLRDFDGAAVAYSGGVDSTVLLKIVSRTFSDKHVGVFVDSPLMSQRLRDSAIRTAESMNAKIVVAELDWDDLEAVARNDAERCYHCKRAIYSAVNDVADDLNIDVCLDGENASDDHDGRPGRRAASEFSMRSPFCDLGIRRDDVVSYLTGLRLPETIVKDTCMATRIPMGTSFSNDDLRSVERCESFVRNIAGVKQLRVRLGGGHAVVLTSPDEIFLLRNAERKLRSEFLREGLEFEIDENGYHE